MTSNEKAGAVTNMVNGVSNGIYRRSLLKTAAVAAAGALAAPRLSLAADARTLRFIPQANLANLDPVWTTQYVVRNGALLIWDMLYGVDDKLEPQPQMCEGHEASTDFKTWTFKLRPGLKFHDGEQPQPLDGPRRHHGRSDQETDGRAGRGG
jgi:ABC-type transport system substrate-binding protein